jgi:hypothetical protein
MALTPSIIERIRAEVGKETETGVDDDAELEEIYNDTDRGNGNTKRVAWYVYKRRLADLQSRDFDVTTGGALLSRSQRIRDLKARIAELEFALGCEDLGRFRATQHEVLSNYQAFEDTGTELS